MRLSHNKVKTLCDSVIQLLEGMCTCMQIENEVRKPLELMSEAIVAS